MSIYAWTVNFCSVEELSGPAVVLRYLSAYVLPPPLLVVLPLAAWILPSPCDLCGVHFGESSLKVRALRTPTWHGVLVMMTVLMMRRMTGMRRR
jgi:hypothetical protein